MSTPWQLPEIPDTADGFAITRVLDTTGWTGQAYENTGADGGASSVRKVLAVAHRLKTVAQFDTLTGPAPYAVVTLVDDVGNDIEGLTFSIPTHQAFLWWAALMPLKPIESDWLDEVTATWPEEPRVELLLTPETARLLNGLIGAGLVFADNLPSDESRVIAAQVLDALQRLTGYAENDQRSEPFGPPTPLLNVVLDLVRNETGTEPS